MCQFLSLMEHVLTSNLFIWGSLMLARRALSPLRLKCALALSRALLLRIVVATPSIASAQGSNASGVMFADLLVVPASPMPAVLSGPSIIC
jgi:hypothetical protein